MVDLHTHTTLSDGGLCPAELIRRAEVVGYKFMAITDHVDIATVETIVPQLVRAAEYENRRGEMLVIPGAEVTHVRPEQIAEVVKCARACGALLVSCHGETIYEPVQPGTNRAAIEAGVDVLAHPGLISDEDVQRAVAENVALEVTGKLGHSYTNGHVVQLARKYGATMVYGSDGHVPSHLRPREDNERVLRGAGLSKEEVDRIFADSERLLRARDAHNDAKDLPV
jgi:histidinol phosphatase-like PHP family hydrolase